LEWSASQLKVESWEDWYQVKAEDLIQLGGTALVSYYGNSPANLLMTVFPHYQWKPWLFKHFKPRNYWEDPGNVRMYFDWLITLRDLESPLKLANKNRQFISDHEGNSLLRVHSLRQALAIAYPGISSSIVSHL
jgi:hypothetical protein